MSAGLLVDYGGVLTTSVLSSFAAFASSEGSTPEALAAAVRDITQKDDLFARVEIGVISLEEFEAGLAEALSVRLGAVIAAEGLKTRMFAGASADEVMIDALRTARRAGIRTGLVSNSWGIAAKGSAVDYPRALFDELFDVVVISGEVGLRKPDREIYELAARRIGVAVCDCVFIDDFKVNVDGATAAGMRGIWHRDTPETITELEKMLGLALSARG